MSVDTDTVNQLINCKIRKFNHREQSKDLFKREVGKNEKLDWRIFVSPLYEDFFQTARDNKTACAHGTPYIPP